jgi:hypothetical protein
MKRNWCAASSLFLLTLTCCSAATGETDHDAATAEADAVPAPAAGAEDLQRAKRSAAPPELSERRAAYLALGDSVAFGEDGFIP